MKFIRSLLKKCSSSFHYKSKKKVIWRRKKYKDFHGNGRNYDDMEMDEKMMRWKWKKNIDYIETGKNMEM